MLGGFSVRLDGRPVEDACYGKMRALLAYLALESGRAHSREALAGLLWAGNDPITARGNLRRTLSDLRRVLETPSGPELFAADKQTVRLLPVFWLDVNAFDSPLDGPDQDERSISLYAGDFLAGLHLPDAPEFQVWAENRREGLQRRALALLERQAQRSLEQGNYPKAQGYVMRHLALAPWDEPAHRLAMRIFALSGQESAAREQYAACRRVLEQELGVAPDTETDRLHASILAGGLRPSLSVPSQRKPASAASVERRQLTVLYCELTAFADDPEDAALKQDELLRRCIAIVDDLGGHALPALVGGLVAYFGYPLADEHAVHRAVRAALAATALTDESGALRASVHTGMVVVGDDDVRPDVAGRITRQALHMLHGTQAAVTVSGDTYRLVEGYVVAESLGPLDFPGASGVCERFRVTGESGARTRLDASARLTPLAGRSQELARFSAWWQDAVEGRRRTILIRGEPGIGKSRLVQALRQSLAGQQHQVRELRCFPEANQSPLHPFITLMEAQFGFLPGDAPDVRFGKLVAYVEREFPAIAREAIPCWAPLLSLPLGHGYAPLDLSPRRIKERTRELLLAVPTALAARQPMLLILEDLHWIDPSSRELLDLFITRQGAGAVLVIMTARPEFVPDWPQGLDATLSLGPLEDADVADIVAAVGQDIPASVCANIVSRADGVPLFAEEMAKFASAGEAQGIPATLKDLLAARVDVLGPAKAVAQLAATQGREFDLQVLHHAAPPDMEVATAVSALEKSGLVEALGPAGFQFKHALVQEAAYESQTKAARLAAHGRIARALCEISPEVAEMRPELLAHHFACAGDAHAAIRYWTLAGQRAARNAAYPEAIAHFDAALKQAAALPDEAERNGLEFSLLVALGPVLNAAKGYGAKEVAEANARIRQLVGVVGDGPDLYPAKWGLIIGTIAAVGSRGMPEAARQLRESVRGNPVLEMAAQFLVTNASFWLGEFAAGAESHRQVMALSRPEWRPVQIEQFGTDITLFSAGLASFARWFLGEPEQALVLGLGAVDEARASGHQHTLAQALSYAAALYRWLNRPEEAAALATEAIEISLRHEFPLWIACGYLSRGWAKVMLGRVEEGLEELHGSIALMRQSLGGISVVFLASLIDSYLHLGRYGEALEQVEIALADAAATGDGHYLSELHRLKGECLLGLASDNQAQALASFDQAIALAASQGALALELRAAVSKARLLHRMGRGAEGAQQLTAVYGRFAEGGDTFDLCEAKRCLDLLSA